MSYKHGDVFFNCKCIECNRDFESPYKDTKHCIDCALKRLMDMPVKEITVSHISTPKKKRKLRIKLW
jgi:hypothetical protein